MSGATMWLEPPAVTVDGTKGQLKYCTGGTGVGAGVGSAGFE